jgi:hypothetical protein
MGGSSQIGGAAGTAGGVAGTGAGSPTGGTSGTAGTAGQAGDGGGGGAGGTAGAGAGGTSGVGSNARGPCDIYQDAGQPCAAAYSTVRRLSSTYAGPLYQIRSGSSDQNTGSGGETLDIGQTSDGFADAAAVDAACAGTICTVSLLYDQSGKGNHLSVAKKGLQFGGPNAALDNFESSATKGSLMVGGHKVYSLYMEPRQGYRLPRVGDGVPYRMEQPQGIYMLADGTRAGVGCCWDFANAPPNAQSYADVNGLFYGRGVPNVDSNAPTVGAGAGPWFMWDVGPYVWAGGSTAVDPLLWNNPNNPSLEVKFALGFHKTDPHTSGSQWALRMADVTTAAVVTTAQKGALPRPVFNGGGVVLGINSYNSNDSWGTFYEGAIVAGFPADDTDDAVLQNIRAVRYGE